MADALAAAVEVACIACGDALPDVVRTRDELRGEQEALERFHRRRLRRWAGRALEERASFTHDYPTLLVRCRRCALLYRSPRPEAADVRTVYEEERYADERLDQLERSQLASARTKARALVRRLGAGARVLEPGSYVGAFLEAAREAGLDATGLDPSRQLARRASRRGFRVEQATLEELAPHVHGATWDAICIWNTFDQIPDPGPTLRAARALLRPEGTLVIRVPNGAAYARWAGPRRGAGRGFAALAWNNLVAFPYLFGHSVQSLDRLLGAHGFTDRDVEGDTLCTLADADYEPWARAEERVTKAWQRLRARAAPETAPWLDVAFTAPRDPASS